VHAAGRARRLPARALLVTALSACPGKSLPSGLTRGWEPVFRSGHAQDQRS
jgi:hypothetical protein